MDTPNRSASADHPRVRGEKCSRINSLREDMGSPPRARGKVKLCAEDNKLVRITPACAGKSNPIGKAVQGVIGSPPRARGKGNGIKQIFDGVRITPACAGKSLLHIIALLLLWDHPRVRGEKQVAQIKINALDGITPACAGKSLEQVGHDRKFCHHPRVRGEKSALFSCPLELRGSPPRARGKVNQLRQDMAAQRITPACAGKSCLR